MRQSRQGPIWGFLKVTVKMWLPDPTTGPMGAFHRPRSSHGVRSWSLGEHWGFVFFLQVFSISHIDNINKVNSVNVMEFGNIIAGEQIKGKINVFYLKISSFWKLLTIFSLAHSAEKFFIMFPIHFEKLGAVLTTITEVIYQWKKYLHQNFNHAVWSKVNINLLLILRINTCIQIMHLFNHTNYNLFSFRIKFY